MNAEVPVWSTYTFPAGRLLAHSQYRLFTTPLGIPGQGSEGALDCTMTNIKEGSRLPSAHPYEVQSVVVEFIARDVNPLLLLACAYSEQGSELDQHMRALAQCCVLSWESLNTCVDIGIPTMARDPMIELPDSHPEMLGLVRPTVFRFDYSTPVLLPGNTTFGVRLHWGGAAPVSPGFLVRVCLYGSYQVVSLDPWSPFLR